MVMVINSTMYLCICVYCVCVCVCVYMYYIGVPEVPTSALPVPTLFQAPLTQFTQ